jgi:hypothetical protein
MYSRVLRFGQELPSHTTAARCERPDAPAARLGVERADVFGFSMGSAAGWQLAIRRPELICKFVGAISYKKEGIYPEVLASLQTTFSPDAFAGSPI